MINIDFNYKNINKRPKKNRFVSYDFSGNKRSINYHMTEKNYQNM